MSIIGIGDTYGNRFSTREYAGEHYAATLSAYSFQQCHCEQAE